MRNDQDPVGNALANVHFNGHIKTRSDPSASLRDVLKRATSAAHVDLEATALMRSVSAGVPRREAYIAYLVSHWRVHVRLEAMLAAQLPTSWTRGRLLKSKWLEADLQSLGQPLPSPLEPELQVRSSAQALGVMYVLEGATLGLSIVVRRLPDTHPAVVGAGRFMAAYGIHTGSRWREFQRILDTVDRDEWPLACSAANGTFSMFQHVFETAWP